MADDSLTLARKMVDIASDKQASDIVLLDLRKLGAFTDFFVVLNGDSSRQLNAIADAIDEETHKLGVALHHREGTPESGWLALDFGPVVVHLFDPEHREFYGLDTIWQTAPALLRIQ
jgi:ribosome-associated protein